MKLWHHGVELEADVQALVLDLGHRDCPRAQNVLE